MNPAQIEGAIRSVVIAAGAVLAATGHFVGVDWVPLAGTIASGLGGMIAVGGLIWSLWSNRNKNLITQAAKAPEVISIKVDDPILADAIPSPKVVSPLT